LVAYIFAGTFLVIMSRNARALLQKEYVRLAIVLFCLSTLCLLLFAAFRFGGVRSSSYMAAIVVIMFSGMFLRGRITTLVTTVIILSGVLLLVGEKSGTYQPDTFYLTPLNSLLANAMIFIMAATLLGVATRRMRISLHQAAQELEDRRRTEITLRRQAEYLAALHETTLSVINRLEILPLLDSILTKAEELLDTQHGFIDLALPDRSGTQQKVGHGILADFQGQITLAGQGITGRVFVTGEPFVTEDYQTLAFKIPTVAKIGNHASIAIPLKLGEQVIGVIGLAHTQPGKIFTPDQVELLEHFGELVALTLDNARLYQDARDELAERKRAEAALIESDERLRLALDAAHMGIWDWDIKTNRIIWSEQAYTIFGGASKAFTGSYENFISLILPEDRQAVIHQINENLNHPYETFHVEFRIGWADRSVHWLEEKGRVYSDAEGKPVRMAGSVTDITDRKTAQQELTAANENLERYTAVLEQRSEQLRVAAEVSRAASEILEPAQLGQQVVDLVCVRFHLYYVGLLIVDETNKWAILTAAAGHAGKKMLEIGHKLEIGNTSMVGWCIANRQPRIALDVDDDAVRLSNPLLPGTRSELALPLGTRGQMLGALNIQSDREAAFSQEEIAIFQTMADQLANAILNARLYDQLQQELAGRRIIEQEIVELNQGLADRIEGRTADLRASEEKFRALTEHNPLQITRYDLDGRYLYVNRADFDHLLKPEDLIGKTIREALGDSGFADFAEECIHQVFGTKQPLRTEYELDGEFAAWWLAPEFDPTGNVISVIASTMNITKRKRIEQELQQRSIELQAINKELEAFSYSVSHDLRAPLRSIDGFSRILIEEFKDTLPAEAGQYLQHITDASAHMGQLIDDLLRLSRITRAELHLGPVDLTDMATCIIKELISREPTRKIKTTVEPGISAQGDERLLQVALENLLNNAWKFTMKTNSAEILVGKTSLEDRDVFYVQDNGVGFDMLYADKLFGAFQRLHSAEDFPGMGIGLAIVQRVIHKHGGQIWAESRPNKGTTFYFML
jgi:PAS domain S-box-containing protein